MSQKAKSENIRYTLSKKSYITLILYFIIILILGLSGCIIIFAHMESLLQNNLLLWTVICSLCSTCSFSAIHYIKVLYKAAITERIDISNDNSLLKIGNIVYFTTRPIFAIAFSVILVIGLMGGIVILTPSIEFIINERFLYLSVILSSIIGFATGNVLDSYSFFSKERVEKFFESKNEKGNKSNDDN